jgi:ribosomal protein S18 acetylase RimI-like enzyme
MGVVVPVPWSLKISLLNTLKRLEIQTATADDASLIATISRETFYDSFADQNTAEDMQLFLNTQFASEKLMAEVLDPLHIYFIAFLDDQPVGYCKIKPGAHSQMDGSAEAIEICRFYARKNSIGKGIGKAMMQHALSYAASLGKKKVWLGVWEKNHRAIAFYQSFGFSKLGEHDFLLGTDLQRDWLMQKDV